MYYLMWLRLPKLLNLSFSTLSAFSSVLYLQI